MTKKSKSPHDPKPNKWQEFAENNLEQDMEEETIFDQDELDSADEAAPKAGIGYPSHEELEQEMNKLEMQLAEYKDAAIRAKAEADNTRRRAERDVQNAHKYGTEKLLTDLLPVVDGLVRGLEGEAPQDKHAQSLREGMQLTLDLLEKTLEKHGIEVIDPAKGDAFNPEQHEAMSMMPAPGAKPNTIVQVLQKGYLLNGRVIRAAMVMVAS